MDALSRYTQASLKTANDLRTIARSSIVQELSHLTLPEIDAAVELVGRLVPSGNVPGMILNGLARLAGRRPPPEQIKRDVQLLFQGVEQVLDRAVYAAFFAGPAAVIWGYQNLLKLAGVDPADSFPEGTWQFYVEYALREDTARHANETHGFDTLLQQHGIQLAPVDRLTAWVMAAIHCLHQYPQLLENEWRERVYIHLLAETSADERYRRLHQDWLKQRPYGRGPDCPPQQSYPAYRRAHFDRFLQAATADLTADLRRRWTRHLQAAEKEELPAYQRQMSLLAYLEPGPYGEVRVPLALGTTHIGVIHGGDYCLIAACRPGTDQPADAARVRAQVAALLERQPNHPAVQLAPLARVRRAHWPKVRPQLNPQLLDDIKTLHQAPILINNEQRPRLLALAELRQAERGVGDHPLTLFDTGESMVFDQSHIFFDGVWGITLAEILTNEALSWAVYLRTLPPLHSGEPRLHLLPLPLSSGDQDLLRQIPTASPEVSAEVESVKLKAILALRKLLKQRSDLFGWTVNDLLILYRAIHALTYNPAAHLLDALHTLARQEETRPAATAALEAFERSRSASPAILIPIDASQHSPRERLYPMSFEVPLAELDLLELHRKTVAALDAYEQSGGDRSAAYSEFNRLQRAYLAALAGFGAVMAKAKQMAIAGESTSVGALKLLAHLPPPLQRLLDKIPSRFDVLNDIIKGREVFSNVGAVAPTSTLTRFITAKDDNDKKTLAWGVLTDAHKQMRITLRDFRPHVGLLETVGQKKLATELARDYLESYAHGLNQYVGELQRITLASRETRSTASPQD